MPLGTEVGLGLRDTVFAVDPATLRKKAHPPHAIFGPCLLWPNGWMDEDAAWYGSRSRPRPHCTRRGPRSRERGTAVPLFSAHVYCGHGRPSQLLLNSCYLSLLAIIFLILSFYDTERLLICCAVKKPLIYFDENCTVYGGWLMRPNDFPLRQVAPGLGGEG